MGYKYPVRINGTDITGYIVPGSYSTSVIPVYSDAVTTMDGVTHVELIRTKHTITFALNPVSNDQTAALFAQLRAGKVQVEYTALDSGNEEIGTFQLDAVSASYLYGVTAKGKRWNSIQDITLTEL